MKRWLLLVSGLAVFSAASAQSPVITILSPTRNAPSAPRSASISVTFSQLLGTGSLHVFSNQRGGRLTGITNTNGNTLTFTPGQAFRAGEPLSVTIPASIQSTSGTSVAPQVYEFLAASTASTGTFAGGSTFTAPALSYLNSVSPADVDNDSDLDLLVTGTSSTGTVLVLLNNGNGSFSTGTSATVASYAYSGATADIDGDGDLDLLTTNGTSISLRLNSGSGIFSGNTTLAAGQSPVTFKLSDLDADGDLDLLYINRAAGTANVMLNDGAGAFSAGTSFTLGSPTSFFTLGDVDGNGTIDLVVGARFDNTAVYYNAGNATFSSAPTLAYTGFALRDLALADIDGDGDLDLLAAQANNIVVGRNNGTGNFSSTANVAAGPDVQAVNAADVDGNGTLDLLTTNYSAGSVSIRLNNGTGVFTAAPDVALGGSIRHINTADVNNDGILDLLAVDNISSQVKIRLNQSATPLTVTSLMPGRNQLNVGRNTNVTVGFNQPINSTALTTQALQVMSNQRGRLIGTATVNGNNLVFAPSVNFRPGEVLSASLGTGVRSGANQLQAPQVYQFTAGVSSGTGTFGAGSTLSFGLYTPYLFTMGDADADGDIDLFYFADSYGNGSSAIQLRRNNGDGTFGSATYITTAADPSGLVLTDVDSDGDLDLLVSGGATGYTNAPGIVRVHLNNGTGTYTVGQTISFSATTQALTVGDVDGDGDPDLVTLASNTTVHINLNLGNGTFGSSTRLGIFSVLSASLHLADIDSDGDLDLLMATNSTVYLSFNNGTGSFGNLNSTTGPGGAVTLADVDSDGDLDLLSVSGGRVTVRHNNGSGVFTVSSTVAVTGTGTPTGIATGDVDGDGDLDVLTGTNSALNVASVRLNDGTGTFGGGSDPNMGSGPSTVALADLDNDGDLDIVAALYSFGGINGLSIRLNLVPPTISMVAPTNVSMGSIVTLNGTNFTGTTSITLNGQPILGFTVVNSTTITFTVPSNASTGMVTVTTPGGTATSNIILTVLNPVPVFTAVSPTSVLAGSASVPITVIGSGFVSQSQVLFNGVALATTFVSTTQLLATIPASSLTTAGTYVVTVNSPAPGGGTTTRNFLVTPVLSSQLATIKFDLMVYPNPARQTFVIQARGAALGHELSVELLNQLGQTVAQSVLRPATDGTIQATIPIHYLPAGLYTVRLHTNLGIVSRRLSIQ